MLSSFPSVRIIKKSVVACGFGVLMGGCSFMPKPANELIENQGGYAEDYQLDAGEYSEATRFTYAVRHIQPKRNVNNLDNYYEDVKSTNTLANTASAATIGLAAVSKISSFNAVMGLLAQQGSDSGYAPQLGEQMLYTVVTVDESKDLDAQAVAANQISINTVKAAMGDSANSEYFPNDGGYLQFEFTKVTGSEDKTCNAVYDGCYSNTWRIPYLVRGNNGQVPLLPKGDVIVTRTWLPIGFPIDKLHFANIEGVEQYLFVPALKTNQNQTLWQEKNMAYLTEWYKQERISVNPYIKDLKDGTIMYFNPKITAKQKDSHSLYRVFNLSN